jgi:cell wall-associated NlpC family hydrolase
MRNIPILALALAALSGACASTGGTPRPFPMPAPPHTTAQGPAVTPPDISEPRPPEGVASPAVTPLDDYALVGTALDLRGVPYKNGGTDLAGFDCSGFTQYVFARYGVPLPREVRDQFKTGEPVELEQLEPGDLIFFATTARQASHVGIAVGGNAFIHAPSSTGVVRVERLSSSYWAPRIVGGRRVLPR